MSGRPPPPPPPPPSATAQISLVPRGSITSSRPAVPPPAPPPSYPPGPIKMELIPDPPAYSARGPQMDETEATELGDAFDEMMNIDTEQELYANDEEPAAEAEERPVPPPPVRVAPVAPPPRAPPAPPSAPSPVPPRAPVAPPPLPSSPPPPLPSMPPPSVVSSPPPRVMSPPEPRSGPPDGSDNETHEGLSVGTQIYVPELANVWGVATITGKVLKDLNSKLYHVKYANGNKNDVDFATTPHYPVNPQIMADMTALHHLHEPGILFNLRHRFLTQNAPYTYMASALIAVNPLHPCPEPLMSAYKDQPVTKVAPHPFAVAEAAYQNLSFSKINQSIVISGVSGAGKTETAKIILRYLAARSPDDSAANVPFRASTRQPAAAAGGNGATTVMHKVEGLDAKLVDSSPLLESFGNAKTLRNNNSSRFGKFLKLCFSNGTVPGSNARTTTGMTLIGALVETYLLEKNRVTTQGPGECNFHIFYQLLNSRYAPALYLKGVSFSILSAESVRLFGQIKEAATLPTIEAALTLLGLSTTGIDNLWRILAGVMHLSNIVFEDHESPEGNIAVVEIKSMTYLRYAAELWAVDQNALLNLLTKREMYTRGEAYLVQYTVKEASFARDAIAKAVYEALFAHIVRAINRSLVLPDSNGGAGNPALDLSKQYFVGVLDIFGFENFDHNGFEQLLINYANEALQNTFNEQLFEKEVELFRSENIDFSVSDCPSNRDCVQLIASRNNSIFKTLDSVSRQPKPSDERFCEELHKAFCTEKNYFLPVHKKDMRAKFCIKHYAGEVTYSVAATLVTSTLTIAGKSYTSGATASTAATAAAGAGWISKNNDSIPDGLMSLYLESKLPEFRALVGVDDNASQASAAAAAVGGAPGGPPPHIPSGPGAVRGSVTAPVRRKSVMLKPTIVEVFSKSMDNLNALLQSTTCQFVRCIKPNEAMVPGEVDNRYVLEQVRSLGILQACEVLKVSLPTRITYAQLREALGPVIRRVQHLFTADSEVVLIACLLRAFNISTDLYRLGKTMVFFRPGQLARLEAMLTLKDAAAGGQDADIVQRIEESHAINQKGLALVRRIEGNFQESELQYNELEKKFERLSTKAKNLPEVRSLDIPEDIVQKISLIESFLASASRKHQAVSVRLAGQVAVLENSVQMRGVMAENVAELKRQAGVCNNEVKMLADLLAESRDGYDSFNQQIQALEEQCGGISALFGETMEANDVLYERIQDERNTCEDLTIRAKEQAERCQLDRVEALVHQCTEAGRKLKASMAELQRGIEVALAEIDKFESSADNVDFAPLTKLAVTVINKLDHCQRGIAHSETSIAQFEKSLKTAKSGALIEGVPPPRPLTQAPPVQAPSPADGAETRKAAVNFSAKDLAALKQKKAAEESTITASAASAAATATTTGSGPVRMAPGFAAAAVAEDDAAEDPDALPEGWVEKFDKKSNRPYYVNLETKARQWKRPEREARPRLESAAATSVAVEDEDGLISYVLPPGWKELFDKKTGRPYYVNSETKERQWRRPDNARKSTRLSGSPVKNEEGDAVDVQINRRQSRRFPGKQIPAYLSEEQGGAISNKAAAKVALARKVSARILEADEVEERHRNTVSYMCRIGNVNKKGFLMKQSKYIGRWKRRHFVLTDDLLEYWDRLQDYALGREGKTFFLSGSCQTAFTSTQNCFCVSNPNEEDESSSWYLLADTEEDMLEWMAAINAHIHMRYLAEWHITTDFWDRGNVETSFWRMPVAAAKDVLRRPVGIRSLPINDGPRTGEGVYPGEIVEVVQIIEQPAARHVWAQRFLRLADDRGWVLENHPKANYAVMVPVSGTLIEDDTLRYVYSADCLEELEIYNSPNCDEDHLTGLRLHPGAILRCVAQWTTTTAAVSMVSQEAGAGETDNEDGNEELVFVKLADGLGWAPMYHPVTGGQILSLVSAPPSTKGVSTSNPTARIKSEPALDEDQDIAPVAKSAKATKASKAAAAEAPAEATEEPARPKLTKQKSSTAKKPAAPDDKPAPPSSTKGSAAAPPPPPASVSTAATSSSKSDTASSSTKLKKAVTSPTATATVAAFPAEPDATDSKPTTPAQRYKEGLARAASTKDTSATTAAAGGAPKELNALEKPRRRVVKPIRDS